MLKLIPFYGTLLGRKLTDTVVATHSHVLVYGAIEAHGQGEKGCIASNKTIANETGLKESSVSTIISTLAKAGWVRVTLTNQNRRTGISALMDIKPALIPIKAELQSPLMIEHSREHSRDKTHTSTQDVDERTGFSPKGAAGTEPLSFSAERAEHLTRVFQALVKILHPGQSLLFTAGRKAHLNARLKTFKPSQIVEAAKNLMEDPWNTGQNPTNKKYASYDFLMRKDEQVEKWLNEKPVKQRKSAF